MTKEELRTKYKALRKELSQDKIDTLSIAIANQLLTLDMWEYKYYHIFLSIEEQHEVNTEFILNILNGKDKNIVIPKSSFETFSMKSILLTDNTLIKKNQYNIPEPVDGLELKESLLDVLFVPLLTFDNHGNRLGYGKGFYDRFIEKCNPDIVKIGLSFFEAESLHLPTNATDLKLNYCVTPHMVYQF